VKGNEDQSQETFGASLSNGGAWFLLRHPSILSTSKGSVITATILTLQHLRMTAITRINLLIWVIGSAVAGNVCLTWITGEAYPDDDYEMVKD